MLNVTHMRQEKNKHLKNQQCGQKKSVGPKHGLIIPEIILQNDPINNKNCLVVWKLAELRLNSLTAGWNAGQESWLSVTVWYFNATCSANGHQYGRVVPAVINKAKLFQRSSTWPSCSSGHHHGQVVPAVINMAKLFQWSSTRPSCSSGHQHGWVVPAVINTAKLSPWTSTRPSCSSGHQHGRVVLAVINTAELFQRSSTWPSCSSGH